MSTKQTPTNPIEALFAEAVEAVESIEKKQPNGLEIELEMDNSKQTDEGIEIELDISDFGEEEIEEVAADEIVTKEIEEKTELDLEQVLEELENAKLRIYDLEGEQSSQEAQLKKAKKIILKRKAETERLKDKLEFTQKELIQHRMLLQNAQGKIETISRRLSDAEVARDQSSSRVMQLQAALDQSQERLSKEQLMRSKENDENRLYGGLKVMRNLLPALDNLQLSLKHQDGNVESFASGIIMVEKQMLSILSNLGLNSVEAEPDQEFDPNIHEAMLSVPSEDHVSNTIVEVIRSGYSLHDRLVRAARVSVAVPVSKTENTETSMTESEETTSNPSVDTEAAEEEELEVGSPEETEQTQSEPDNSSIEETKEADEPLQTNQKDMPIDAKAGEEEQIEVETNQSAEADPNDNE